MTATTIDGTAPTLAVLLALPAGRELDRAIAVHVMGWKEQVYNREIYFVATDGFANFHRHFKPSRKIGHAHDVLHHLNEQGRSVRIVAAPHAREWMVLIGGDYHARGTFEELPLAICRAALRACLQTGSNQG